MKPEWAPEKQRHTKEGGQRPPLTSAGAGAQCGLVFENVLSCICHQRQLDAGGSDLGWSFPNSKRRLRPASR